jgi:choline dehydrogenase-like flavoprotein
LTIRTKGNRQINQLRTEGAKVILSAGSIGTASIALTSGLQLHNPLVGKGLMDHDIYYVRIAVERDESSPTDPLNLQCVVKIGDELALLTVTINANFFLAGSTTLQTGQYWSKDGHILDPHDNDVLAGKYFDTMCILLQFGAELDDRNEVLNLPTPDPVIRVRRPISHNGPLQEKMRGLATNVRDAVLKSARPDFTFAPDSKNSQSPTGGENDVDAAVYENVPALTLLGFGVFSHEVGTMRMKGPGDKPGVVDTNLKVDGFENLYVCDLSVFPYSPPANPSLTLAALSLRLSDHLEPPQHTPLRND